MGAGGRATAGILDLELAGFLYSRRAPSYVPTVTLPQPYFVERNKVGAT